MHGHHNLDYDKLQKRNIWKNYIFTYLPQFSEAQPDCLIVGNPTLVTKRMRSVASVVHFVFTFVTQRLIICDEALSSTWFYCLLD